jgi:hypothetical protein
MGEVRSPLALFFCYFVGLLKNVATWPRAASSTFDPVET